MPAPFTTLMGVAKTAVARTMRRTCFTFAATESVSALVTYRITHKVGDTQNMDAPSRLLRSAVEKRASSNGPHLVREEASDVKSEGRDAAKDHDRDGLRGRDGLPRVEHLPRLPRGAEKLSYFAYLANRQ